MPLSVAAAVVSSVAAAVSDEKKQRAHSLPKVVVADLSADVADAVAVLVEDSDLVAVAVLGDAELAVVVVEVHVATAVG